MVMTDTMSIPVEHRGFLLKHRDGWSVVHGVKVWFPQNERFGGFQTMHLEGMSASIRAVKRLVDDVLREAEDEHRAYKERCALRKRENPRVRLIVNDTTSPKTTPKTMFDVLEGLGDEDPFLKTDISVQRPKKVKLVLQGAWKNGTPTIDVPTIGDVSNCTISGDWGDESDDE